MSTTLDANIRVSKSESKYMIGIHTLSYISDFEFLIMTIWKIKDLINQVTKIQRLKI